MDLQVALRPHFHVEIVDESRLVFFSEDSHFLLQGKAYVAIVKELISGSKSRQDLVHGLQEKFSKELLETAFERLIKKQFISAPAENGLNEIAAFWSDHGIDPLKLEVGFSKQIAIKSFSQFDITGLKESLESLGFLVGEKGRVTLVIVDNYINHELDDFAQSAKKNKIDWMVVKPSGKILWMGPIFHGEGYCWECLVHSLKENKRVEVDLFGADSKDLNIRSKHCLAAHGHSQIPSWSDFKQSTKVVRFESIETRLKMLNGIRCPIYLYCRQRVAFPGS